MSDIIQWGILGTAKIARTSVGPGINLAKNAEIAAIAGRKEDKLKEFGSLLGAKRLHKSYEDLLDDPEIQAVYIPLPNGLHQEWILKAIAKGKHVLCEKPLCLNEAQAKEVFEAADKKGVLLAEAFAYIHNPLIQRAKEIVKSGKLGSLRSIDGHFYFLLDEPDNIRWDKDLGGGAAYDIGCYPLSLIRFLADEEPEEVLSHNLMTPKGVDIHSSGVLLFPSGVTSVYHCGFDTGFSMGCRVFGTQGWMEIPMSFNQKGNLYLEIHKDGKVIREEVFSQDNYQLEVEDFSRAILGGGRPMVSPEHTLGNARVIDRILKG